MTSTSIPSVNISITAVHISRIFKDRVGISIPDYINEVRVKHTKFLLESTDLSIREVAKSVGYDDPFYFPRIFKGRDAVPPIQ